MHMYACIVGDSRSCSVMDINSERHKKEHFDVNLIHKSEKEALVSFISLNVGTILTGVTAEDIQKDEQSKSVLVFTYLFTCRLQIKDYQNDVSETVLPVFHPCELHF